MELVAVVVCLALLELAVFAFISGNARGKYGVPAPATSGHPTFERHFRVHQNSVEQMVMFLPGIFLFALFVNAPIGALIGLIYVIARIWYAWAYVQDPAKRTPGFLVSMLSTQVLVLGGLIGAIVAYVR